MQLTVNGIPHSFTGDLAKPLLWVLRETLGLTGTKFGCGHDLCGACTVHLDGAPVHACKVTMAEIADRAVVTIEGLGSPAAMDRVQAAWVAHDVGQCGYCQPGMIMAVDALLKRSPSPNADEVAAAVLNLCRCATYTRAKQAIASVVAGSHHPRASVRTDDAETFIGIGPFVEIGSHGSTIIKYSQSEMGQGSSTGLPMLVAEELDCDWAKVRPQLATGDDVYRITLLGYHGQFVGGSLSSRLLHDRLRQAGAAVRHALLSAGARQMGVPASDCSTEDSFVSHPASGRRLAYANLATEASTLVLAQDTPLKSADAFRLIGHEHQRLDAVQHVTGTSIFGMDVTVPGMLVGAIRYAGGFGVKVASFDDAAARAMPGVTHVVALENAVVVVANGYWEAQAGADALTITGQRGEGDPLSTAGVFAANRAALDKAEAVVAVDRGGADRALLEADRTRHHRAEFQIPYIAHATIEPVVATVHIEEGRATVWAPTQGQDVIRDRISKLFTMPEEAVTVHTTFIGGGFGRKFVPDFVIEAAFASKACGRPVKLIRSREEDLRQDFYRPGLVACFEAVTDAEGYPEAVRARIAGQSLLYQMFPMWVVDGVDEATVEGTHDQPYAIPRFKVEMVDVPQIIPMGFLRSVGRSANVFFVESFLDELAHKACISPIDYRQRMLVDDPRALAVLQAVTPALTATLPKGHFRGLAYAPYIGRGRHFTTRVAIVIEIAQHHDGRFSVEHATVAIDAGLIINPNIVRAQVEGCVGFALSSVIKGEITFTDGLVEQRSFEDFRLLTLGEMPDVETIIIKSDDPEPGGVGEAAMPVIGPALASALFQATGRRIRTMPFDRTVQFGPRQTQAAD